MAGALDRGAQSAGKASGAIGPLATRLGQVAQKAAPLSAVPEQFKRMPAPIKAAGTAAQKTGQQLQQAGVQGKGFAGAITTGFQQILQGIPTGIGIAIANGITAPLKNLANVIPSAVQAFSELDEQVRQVLAITGSSEDQFGRVAAAIREVGSQSAATNVEVGQIAVALSRAGFSLEQIEASLFAVTQGAEATGTAYGEMADIVVSTLGQFKLAAEDATTAVDLLTQAANSSNQTVADLGQALKYVGPVANTVGQDLKETATQLALLANSGIKASTAGTSLRTLLTNLAIASGGAGEEFQKLSRGSARLSKTLELIGAEMTDANGELKTGTDLIYALQDSIKGLDSGERAIVSKVLAGSEGLPTLSALVNATGQEIELMAEKMDNSLGVAAKAANTNLSGLNGSFKLLQSNISSALSTIGEFIAGFLKPLVDGITSVISAFNGLPGPIKNTVIAITAITAAIGVAKVAMAAFSVAAQSAFGAQVIAYINQFAGALKGATFAQVLNNAATSAGAFAAVLTSNLTKGLQLATKGLQAMTTALNGLTIAQAREGIVSLVSKLPALGKGFQNLGKSFKNGFNPKQVQLDLFSTGKAATTAGAAVQAGGTAAAAGGAKMATAGTAAGGFKASLAGAGAAAGKFAVAAAPIAAIVGGIALAYKGASDLQNSYRETSDKLGSSTKKLNEVLKGNADTIDEASEGQEKWSDNAEKALGPLGTLIRRFTVFGQLMGPVADGLQWIADRFVDLGRWANEWARENAAVDSFNELAKSTGEADKKIRELREAMAGMTEGSKEYREAQQEILEVQQAAADAIDDRITATESEIQALEEAGRGNSNYAKKLREQLQDLKDQKIARDRQVEDLKKEQAELNKLAGITGSVATTYKGLARERAKAYQVIDNQISQTEIENLALVRQGLLTEAEARARAARAAVEAANKKLAKDKEVTDRARALLEAGAIDQNEYGKIVGEVSDGIRKDLENRVESEKALKEATKQAINERLDAYSREQQTIASNIQKINQSLGELGSIGTSAISAFKSLSDASTQYQITGIEKAKQARLDAIDETYKDGVRKENAKRDVERRFENERKKVLQQQQNFNEAAARANYAAKQAELDLWYAQQTVQNQIAQVEAQVAIEKAKAAGASQAEIDGLNRVLELTRFQGGLIGEQYRLKQDLLGVENQAAKAQLAAQARANGVATAYGSAVTNSQALIGKMNTFQGKVQTVVDKTKAFQSTLGEVGTVTAGEVAEQVKTKINKGLSEINPEAARQALLKLGVPPEVAFGMAEDISGAILEGSAEGTIKGRAKIGELFKGLESEIPTALIEKELIDAMSSAATTSREQATEIFKGLPPRMPKEELAKVLADALGEGTAKGQEVLDQIELSKDTTNKLLAAARDGLEEGGKKGGEALNDAVGESKDKIEKNVAEGVTAGLDEASKEFDEWADSNAKALNGAFTESAKGIRDAYIEEYNAVQVEANKALGAIGQEVNLEPLKGQVADALTTPIDEAAKALEQLSMPDNFGSTFEGVAGDIKEAKNAGLAQELKTSATQAGKMKTATSQAKTAASGLSRIWRSIAREAQRAAEAAVKAARARALGGPVQGGQTYQVNEVGREMFMSRGGNLSEIRAPRFGNWTAPSSGTVIPAHMAEQIREGKQNAATKVALAAAAGPGMTQVKVQQASADSDGLQRSLVRELQKLNDGGQGPVNNQITIQSAKPVNDASRMLAEMSRLRTLRRY